MMDHWASVDAFFDKANAPLWVTGEDQTRLMAYDVYEAVYWTAPKNFQIDVRGQEGEPIFVPSGRRIVETAHRYMAPRAEIVADPAFGSDTERETAQLVWLDFARRERFSSKFSANKRNGLRKGDWLWHLFGEPDAPEGRRVSLLTLDPATYFPIYLNDDLATVIGVKLVEPTMVGDKPGVNVLMYEKETGLAGPSTILVSDQTFLADEWGQPGTDMDLGNPTATRLQQEPLPPIIQSIPVYHIPNAYETDDPWGSSEMRGIERLMLAINQAATDEDIALALEGLGVYVTTAGAPVDPVSGEEVAWNLGPARVVEIPEEKDFKRVSGAGTLAPYQQHLAYIEDQLDKTVGGNDITAGRVEVAVAESGIALALRMGPLLFRMEEKELIVTDVTTQMLFDLTQMWFPAYDPTLAISENVRLIPSYGEKLPINKAEVFNQIMAMYVAQPPLISGQEARRQLEKLGVVFSADGTQMFSEILQEQGDFQKVMTEAATPSIIPPTG